MRNTETPGDILTIQRGGREYDNETAIYRVSFRFRLEGGSEKNDETVIECSCCRGSDGGVCVAPWARAQVAAPSVPVTSSATSVTPAQSGVFGLYNGADFRITNDACKDRQAPKQSLWHFENDWIATPVAGVPAAGMARGVKAQDDVRQWYANAQGTERNGGEGRPNMLWMGAPQRAQGVTLSADGSQISFAEGKAMPLRLVERIPTNLSYYNARSTSYFAARPLNMRGEVRDGAFVARTIWPQDWSIKGSKFAADPMRPGESLLGLVRKYESGRDETFEARVLWERSPGAAASGQGRAVLGLMLNGAQGDDDEAHGGHFAVVTGRHDNTSDMSDWMVNNFYNLTSNSEKGIVASILPIDNYMADLNSGQSWYRPSYMLVAVLKSDRAARAYQGAISRVYNHFYRRDFFYHHTGMNCVGISVDTLRTLGWNIPMEGATSHLKAVVAYPFKSVTDMSFASGKQAYDYLSEEKSRLYPAVAFDAAGRDLLQIATGAGGATADNALRSLLHNDLEAVIFARLPQLPSSRAYGNYPAASLDEYRDRMPKDKAMWKIVPVTPRPFPQALIEADTLKDEPTPPWMPAAVAGGVLALLWWWRRARRDRSLALEDNKKRY